MKRARAGMSVTGERRGVALMLALWVLLVLGLASLQVLTEVRSRIDVASLARSRTLARYAAESGVVAAQVLLDDMVRGAGSSLEQARIFGEFQRQIDAWGPRAIGAARYQVAVEDLNARIDLNRSSPLVLQGLFRQFVSDAAAEELVRALRGGETEPDGLDAMQADGVGEPEESLGSPLQDSGSRPLMHLEELPLIPGFGDSLAAAIAPYVTLWSDGLINVNTAPLPVLAAVPDIGDVAANSLVGARDGMGALASKVAVYSELSQRSAGTVDARLSDLTTMPRRILVVSRGWEEGHPYTHEVQAVFDVLASRLVTGSRVRLLSWTERGR